MWAYYPDRYANYVLIAKQNVLKEELLFPRARHVDGGYGRGRLLPSTRLSDIAYHDEVKVPVEAENVVGIISVLDFREIISGYRSQPIHLGEFLKMIAKSPKLFSP